MSDTHVYLLTYADPDAANTNTFWPSMEDCEAMLKHYRAKHRKLQRRRANDATLLAIKRNEGAVQFWQRQVWEWKIER